MIIWTYLNTLCIHIYTYKHISNADWSAWPNSKLLPPKELGEGGNLLSFLGSWIRPVYVKGKMKCSKLPAIPGNCTTNSQKCKCIIHGSVLWFESLLFSYTKIFHRRQISRSALCLTTDKNIWQLIQQK